MLAGGGDIIHPAPVLVFRVSVVTSETRRKIRSLYFVISQIIDHSLNQILVQSSGIFHVEFGENILDQVHTEKMLAGRYR